MVYVLAILLLFCNGVSLFLTLVTLPGNWIMLALTAGVAWWQWDKGMFSVWTLAVVLALAILGEVLEFLASVAGVKKAGGSKAGGWGSLIGALIGGVVGTFAIPIPLFGSLVGACLGACAGAWGFELAGGRKMEDATRSGAAAGVGRLVGTLLKFAIGLVMWAIITVASFWP